METMKNLVSVYMQKPDILKNFFKTVPGTIYLYKKLGAYDDIYFCWSLSIKPDYFTKKSLFLCNNKHFCQEHHDFIYAIFLYSIKLDKFKAVARTFIQRNSENINSLYDSDPVVGFRFDDSPENSVAFKGVSADWVACLTL